jgi:protein PhnA
MITLLKTRSNNTCEICDSTGQAFVSYTIPPKKGLEPGECVLLCDLCYENIQNFDTVDVNYWRCMSKSIWSNLSSVKVLCMHLLKKTNTDWSRDLADQIWLEPEEEQWLEEINNVGEIHKDSNGQLLLDGDDVILIKDLDVKGGGFTAKRGTKVKNIRLVADNNNQIEGKIDGQLIVILTQFVKK